MKSEYSQCLVLSWHCERSVWYARRPVVLWHFPALHYCVESRAFWWSLARWYESWRGNALAFSHTCSFTLSIVWDIFMKLAFSRLPTLPPFFIALFIIYPVSSPQFFQFSLTGAEAGAAAGFFWRVGLMAGLQEGQALRSSGYLGFGSAVPAPNCSWAPNLHM